MATKIGGYGRPLAIGAGSRCRVDRGAIMTGISSPLAGATAIWFLNGLQVLSSAGLGAVGLDWTIQAVNAE